MAAHIFPSNFKLARVFGVTAALVVIYVYCFAIVDYVHHRSKLYSAEGPSKYKLYSRLYKANQSYNYRHLYMQLVAVTHVYL